MAFLFTSKKYSFSKILLSLILMSGLCVFSLIGHSSVKHHTTSPDGHLGDPVPFPLPSSPLMPIENPMWLYSKITRDAGRSQIFLQIHDPSDSSNILTEHQLTNSDSPEHSHIIYRTNPLWGPIDIVGAFLGLHYKATPTAPVELCNTASIMSPETNTMPYTFIYLGTDTITNKRNLYLGCFDDSGGFPVAFFDVPLTNILDDDITVNPNQISIFDSVSSFDIVSLPMLTIPEEFEGGVDLDGDGSVDDANGDGEPDTGNNEIPHFQIVFTTNSGQIHYLTFSPVFMSGYEVNPIFLKYNGETHSGEAIWQEAGWSQIFNKITEVKFADASITIAFIGEDSANKTHIGMVTHKGEDLIQLTNITNPFGDYRFSDLQTNMISILPVPILYFVSEEVGSRKSQIFALLAGQLNATNTFGWYEKVLSITPPDTNRINPTWNLFDGDLFYARQQPDNNYDIYLTEALPLPLLVIFADYINDGIGETNSPVTEVMPFIEADTFVNPLTNEEIEFVFTEIQLTCSKNNLDPAFYQARHSADHTVVEPVEGEDVYPSDLLIREVNPLTNEMQIVHLYELAVPAECNDSCTENFDRSPIPDMDEDGIRDGILALDDGTELACDLCPENPATIKPLSDSTGDGIFDSCEKEEEKTSHEVTEAFMEEEDVVVEEPEEEDGMAASDEEPVEDKGNNCAPIDLSEVHFTISETMILNAGEIVEKDGKEFSLENGVITQVGIEAECNDSTNAGFNMMGGCACDLTNTSKINPRYAGTTGFLLICYIVPLVYLRRKKEWA